MKNFILTLFTTFIATTAFAQTEPYGPVPYKTLEQTIGETYILTKSIPGVSIPYNVKNADNKPLTKTDFPKSLKLISLDRKNNLAHLKDSIGLDYTDDILSDKVMPNLILKNDLDEARKLFLNKKLWLNVPEVYWGQIQGEGNGKKITGIRFDPVIITNILPGYNSELPLFFIIKTNTGEYGFLIINVSGTNSNSQLYPEYAFGRNFLTEDPHLKYHFTPAVWQMVKAGYTEIGMPIDAFRLVMGFPKDIHTTQTAKGTTTQWVYGTEHQSYYYFTNGKLTAKQD